MYYPPPPPPQKKKKKKKKEMIIIRDFPMKHIFVCLKETSQGDVSFTHPKHMISLKPLCPKFISNKRVFRKIGIRIFEVKVYVLLGSLLNRCKFIRKRGGSSCTLTPK